MSMAVIQGELSAITAERVLLVPNSTCRDGIGVGAGGQRSYWQGHVKVFMGR